MSKSLLIKHLKELVFQVEKNVEENEVEKKLQEDKEDKNLPHPSLCRHVHQHQILAYTT